MSAISYNSKPNDGELNSELESNDLEAKANRVMAKSIDFVANLIEMRRAQSSRGLDISRRRQRSFRPIACVGNDHCFVTLSMIDDLHGLDHGTTRSIFEEQRMRLPNFSADGYRQFLIIEQRSNRDASEFCEFVGTERELFHHVIDMFEVYGPYWKRAYRDRVVLIAPEGLWAINQFLETPMAFAMEENRYHHKHKNGWKFRDRLGPTQKRELQAAMAFVFEGRERCCTEARFFVQRDPSQRSAADSTAEPVRESAAPGAVQVTGDCSDSLAPVSFRAFSTPEPTTARQTSEQESDSQVEENTGMLFFPGVDPEQIKTTTPKSGKSRRRTSSTGKKPDFGIHVTRASFAPESPEVEDVDRDDKVGLGPYTLRKGQYIYRHQRLGTSSEWQTFRHEIVKVSRKHIQISRDPVEDLYGHRNSKSSKQSTIALDRVELEQGQTIWRSYWPYTAEEDPELWARWDES